MREFSPPTMGHMLGVKCQVSGVMFYMSSVTCQVSHVSIYLCIYFLGQSGGASRLRVCYQWGLPRLVCWDLALGVQGPPGPKVNNFISETVFFTFANTSQ